jgi:hypothetical protein
MRALCQPMAQRAIAARTKKKKRLGRGDKL